MTYPPHLPLTPLAKPVAATVRVPGSKSITNRALVLAALTDMDTHLTLTGALRSEDTEVMVAALQQLGYAIVPDWPNAVVHFPFQQRRLIPATTADLWVANSGTTVRFLTAMLAAGEGRYRLDGVPRMRERPIQDLLDALNQMPGVSAMSEAGTGCPPVVVETRGLPGGTVHIRAGLSSQFLSGLLMVAPHGLDDMFIEIDGPLVSEPYVAMTVELMRRWGYEVERTPAGFRVEAGQSLHSPMRFAIEPDASSASYFWAAAAVTGGRVTVAGLGRNSLQGDVGFVDLLAQMGCTVADSADGITVTGGPLRGIDCDMNAVSDTVMTLAAVACFADGPTRIRNVAHIRHKETDRIAAVAAELRKLGAGVEEHPDGLTIHPRPLTGCVVDTYQDHRMAMSLAVVGLRVPGVVIDDPGCVAKTYPGFWEDWERLR